MRPADQRHGDRQYLRISREATLLSRRMGEKYTVLPGLTSYRPSSLIKTRLVGIVRSQCISVFYAPPRGSVISGGRPARLSDGGGPGRRVYGPHKDLPRASGEAESAPRRLSGVLLSEGHRPLHDR